MAAGPCIWILLADFVDPVDEGAGGGPLVAAVAHVPHQVVVCIQTQHLRCQAQVEADGMIEKARAAIEAEKKAAIADLQGSVADISVEVASKVIGTDLSDDEHRAIIKRYVEEVGSFNAN